jgi:hypothetical protein
MDVEVAAAAREIEPRQVIEERVARARHEDFVAGVAEQLEEQRIGVARARREHDVLGRDGDALPQVIARDRLARLEQPRADGS